MNDCIKFFKLLEYFGQNKCFDEKPIHLPSLLDTLVSDWNSTKHLLHAKNLTFY